MIIPITNESEWRKTFEKLPEWHPPSVPTLVLSPHPDDETLAVGGLIASLTEMGVDVSVAAATDGENAYEGRLGLGPTRAFEQTAALAVLGLPPSKIHRLRLPDSGLHLVEDELVNALHGLLRPGHHILAPWTGDFHPDHEACGRAAQRVAAEVGATLTFYFFWTWHRGTPSTLRGLSLEVFRLHQDHMRKKNEALLSHQSQLRNIGGRPILTEDLLHPMERTYEVLLPA